MSFIRNVFQSHLLPLSFLFTFPSFSKTKSSQVFINLKEISRKLAKINTSLTGWIFPCRNLMYTIPYTIKISLYHPLNFNVI